MGCKKSRAGNPKRQIRPCLWLGVSFCSSGKQDPRTLGVVHISLKVDKPAGSLARTNRSTELVSSRELVFILR